MYTWCDILTYVDGMVECCNGQYEYLYHSINTQDRYRFVGTGDIV